MKRTEQESLLRDVFNDTPVEALRAKSLDGMLDVARHRRRRRMIISGAAASLVVLMVLIMFTHQRGVAPSTPVSRVPSPTRVKTIDDEQLLALFADRSVALIGSSGDQQLIFLDGRKQ